MRKSKHFRKDVIIARIIAALLLILLIALISFLVSVFVKPSGDKDADSQNKDSKYEEQDDWTDDEPDVGLDDTPVVPDESESEDVSESTTADDSESESEEVYVKTTASVKFRSGPGTSYDVIGFIEKDVEVVLLEEVYGWYKVSYNGKEGYISADYSEKVE